MLETEAREVSIVNLGREKYVSKNEPLSSNASEVSFAILVKSVVGISIIKSLYPVTVLDSISIMLC